MRRPIVLVLALLAVLALPPAALAGPATISPTPSPVSAAGVMKIEAANSGRAVLRGKATIAVGGRVLATRSVRLGKRSVSTIRIRFGGKALEALRAAGGRATMTLKLRGARGKGTTARRALTLQVPEAAVKPTSPAPPPAAPPSNRWVGRMGAEGAYDDLEMTVIDGQMQITKFPMVPVSCAEGGGALRIALSLELFDAPGPWPVGTDTTVEKQGLGVNPIVSGGQRTISYKVSELAQEPGRVSGMLGIFYSDSRLTFPGYAIVFTNCAGQQRFEAIPAP